MKTLNINELENTNGGGIPLLVGLVLGGIALISFMNGCNDTDGSDCYYEDGDGNECPCGS